MVARTFHVIMDSFAFMTLLILSFFLMNINPYFAIFVLLACIDQFDDVYYAIHGRHIYPSGLAFKVFNTIFESVALLVGFGMFALAMIYTYMFPVPFFWILVVLGAALTASSLRDLIEGLRKRKLMERELEYI